MSEYRTAYEHMEAFREAMRAAGVPFSGNIEGDGKLRRFYVEGDRKGGKQNGWYKYFDDERPVGVFGSWKGGKHTWVADTGTCKPMSREDRDEMRRKQEERKAREAAERAEREAKAAAWAQRMWDKAAPAETHPYATAKGISVEGLRIGEFWKENKEGKAYRVATNALLIPVKDSTKTIVGLQAIYAEPIKVGDERRGKDFIYGARKQGCWSTIGAPADIGGVVTIGICEGYATGASAHQATGMAVVVAFDAGNLLHVAREVRRLVPPEFRIVLLADNDQWTEKPVPNPGLTKARDAAQDIGAVVIAPEFSEQSLADEPTDWNDLHALEGLPEVRRQILAALGVEPDPVREREPDPEPANDPVREPEPPRPEDPPPVGDYDAGDPEPVIEDDEEAIDNPWFTVRGHDRTQLYVYQHEMKMVVNRGLADWSEAALTMIAPLHWWELNFPAKTGFDKKVAVNWLQSRAKRKGFFDPECVRGRGAWIDDGRHVFHFGHKLWVDGVMMDVTKIDSGYIYEQGKRMRLPAAEPLSGADGRRLFEMFRHFAWTRDSSAVLLAGWCALAPLGGALRWRPHVWITGGAGSGKTTVLEFVDWLMNGTNLYAQGNSTEAGIRQTLGSDALPVQFDESEQNNDRETQRMQNVLSLIRQSSTESRAQTMKGTQGGEAQHFHIRSMFLLSSIQVGMKQQADMERISVLSLKPKKESGGPMDDARAARKWAEIQAARADIQGDAELPAKLLHRALKLLPVTIENIGVFSRAAAEKFGSQRDGDQYGTLLAGAWSLCSSKVATVEEARAMIERYDWSEYLEGSETEESEKALNALLGKMIRMKTLEVNLWELVGRAANVPNIDCVVGTKEAGAHLPRCGLRIKWNGKDWRDAQLLIANKHPELDRLMESTPYAADLRGQLLRLPGAERYKDPVQFKGVPSRAVSIPLRSVFKDEVDSEDSPPAASGYDEFGDDMAF